LRQYAAQRGDAVDAADPGPALADPLGVPLGRGARIPRTSPAPSCFVEDLDAPELGSRRPPPPPPGAPPPHRTRPSPSADGRGRWRAGAGCSPMQWKRPAPAEEAGPGRPGAVRGVSRSSKGDKARARGPEAHRASVSIRSSRSRARSVGRPVGRRQRRARRWKRLRLVARAGRDAEPPALPPGGGHRRGPWRTSPGGRGWAMADRGAGASRTGPHQRSWWVPEGGWAEEEIGPGDPQGGPEQPRASGRDGGHHRRSAVDGPAGPAKTELQGLTSGAAGGQIGCRGHDGRVDFSVTPHRTPTTAPPGGIRPGGHGGTMRIDGAVDEGRYAVTVGARLRAIRGQAAPVPPGGRSTLR